MITLRILLMILAIICLLIAAVWSPQPPPSRVSLGWLGLALWAIASIVSV